MAELDSTSWEATINAICRLGDDATDAATSGGLARIDVDIPSVMAITDFDNNNLRSVYVDSTDHAKYIGTNSGLEIDRGL